MELDRAQTVRLRDGIWSLTARFGDMVYHRLHSRDHQDNDHERQACRICSPTQEGLRKDETPEEYVVSAIVFFERPKRALSNIFEKLNDILKF